MTDEPEGPPSEHTLDALRSLERDVLPTLGKRQINDIEAHDVLDMLRKIEKRGSIETAKRIRQRISGVFLLAISKRIARDNPAKDLEAALLPKPKAKKQPAIVDLAELRDLLTKTEQSGASPVTLLASRLLALTAVRPGVVRGARWEEFVLEFPAKDKKDSDLTKGEKQDQAFWNSVGGAYWRQRFEAGRWGISMPGYYQTEPASSPRAFCTSRLTASGRDTPAPIA